MNSYKSGGEGDEITAVIILSHDVFLSRFRGYKRYATILFYRFLFIYSVKLNN